MSARRSSRIVGMLVAFVACSSDDSSSSTEDDRPDTAPAVTFETVPPESTVRVACPVPVPMVRLPLLVQWDPLPVTVADAPRATTALAFDRAPPESTVSVPAP